MPLYRKALKFKPEDSEVMTFDECYELMLVFRYLEFREDHSLTKEFIKQGIKTLQKRMEEIDPNSRKYKI